MRSEEVALFRWAYVWDALTPAGLRVARELRLQPHECVEVNDLGNRYRRALSDDQLNKVLSNHTLLTLSKAIGHNLYPLQRRYWDSVLRKPGQSLEAHTDQGEPGRLFAVAIYVNQIWLPMWGGAIFLHDRGVNIPFYPVPNSALIFEVNEHSLHAVQGVLRNNAARHAIVGWFYERNALPPDPAFSRVSELVDVWTPGLEDIW